MFLRRSAVTICNVEWVEEGYHTGYCKNISTAKMCTFEACAFMGSQP